jgi:N-acetylmuramoyl-L-alanine amidase
LNKNEDSSVEEQVEITEQVVENDQQLNIIENEIMDNKPKRLVVILDPAHGIDTPGKRSPDGVHLEYIWSRKVCRMLEQALKQKGFKVE